MRWFSSYYNRGADFYAGIWGKEAELPKGIALRVLGYLNRAAFSYTLAAMKEEGKL